MYSTYVIYLFAYNISKRNYRKSICCSFFLFLADKTAREQLNTIKKKFIKRLPSYHKNIFNETIV